MTVQAAFLNVQSTPDHTLLLARRELRTGSVRLLQFSAALALVSLLLVLPVSGISQVTNPATFTAPASGKPPVAPSKTASSRPAWPELTSAQQKALAPLASNWNTLSEAQKRKWLEISRNYAALPPEGQTTLHSRMNEWVTLSHQQRAQARLNFGKTKELSKELTPEEKKAKWLTYQALSAEEKQKLAAKASPKPAGAATALRPVAPQKLAAIPPHSSPAGTRSLPKIVSPPPATTPSSVVPRSGDIANGDPGPAPQR